MNREIKPANTFDNFVVRQENELAYCAAKAVANDPGRCYNPLLIYGNPDLGKTHLMHAIAHRVRCKNPRIRILNTSGKAFVREYAESMSSPRDAGKQADGEEFKKKYLGADLLLIDGVEALLDESEVQAALGAILDHLHSNRKQVVMTFDKRTRLGELSDRLVACFQGGATVEVNPH